MNLFILIGVLALLALLLAGLHRWQRKIEDFAGRQTMVDLLDAEERGTSRPLAQHPQIDTQACIGCGSCIEACPEDGVLALVEGVARVVHGSRCIGHGLCAEACPVAAVSIGLGDLTGRTDIPILSETFESTVPGVYLAGELGGFALIRVAVDQGVRAIDHIARDLRRCASAGSEDLVDVLIVGAGPAGLAAALRATELGLRYLVIDEQDVGGTVRKYPRRKLTLTGALTLPLYGRFDRSEYLKEELIEIWESIIERYEIPLRSGVRLLGVEGEIDDFEVSTSQGPLAARRVVLALGRRGTPRKLGVPGEESERVLYQLIDAASYRGERILVVGGGDSAVEAAVALAAQAGNRVAISYRRTAFFRLKARNEERLERLVGEGRIELFLESSVEEIRSDSARLRVSAGGVERSIEVPCGPIFVCAGGEPPYALLREIGVSFHGDPPREHVLDLEASAPGTGVA